MTEFFASSTLGCLDSLQIERSYLRIFYCSLHDVPAVLP